VELAGEPGRVDQITKQHRELTPFCPRGRQGTGLLGGGFAHRHAPQLATTLATAPRMLGCLARAPAPTAREGARAGRSSGTPGPRASPVAIGACAGAAH